MRWLLSLATLLLPGVALAQTATCTVTLYSQPTGPAYLLSINMTGARDTTEVACPSTAGILNPPAVGTIITTNFRVSAGTGTILTPVVGRAASFTTTSTDHILTTTSPGTLVQEDGKRTYAAPGRVLYVRPTVNSAATDHTINGEIVLVPGAP